MVEGIDGIHSELQPALALLAEREVLLERDVEELLCWPARIVERARRIPERALDGPLERRRIEIGFARLTDWAIATPARVDERRARHDVRTDGA